MTDAELKKMCDSYKTSIVEEDADRYLMMMARDIERETRHKCVTMAYELASNISKSNQ